MIRNAIFSLYVIDKSTFFLLNILHPQVDTVLHRNSRFLLYVSGTVRQRSALEFCHLERKRTLLTILVGKLIIYKQLSKHR